MCNVMVIYNVMSRVYLVTTKCRGLILGSILVGGCRCKTSWYYLDLTFDLAIVTLTFKIFVWAISMKP